MLTILTQIMKMYNFNYLSFRRELRAVSKLIALPGLPANCEHQNNSSSAASAKSSLSFTRVSSHPISKLGAGRGSLGFSFASVDLGDCEVA